MSHEKEDIPFTLLTKFIIRPSIAKEFVGGWLKARLRVVYTSCTMLALDR